MEYVLTTNNLTKQYKNIKALDNLTMHVPKGSIYGFVGKNGAGKTTLIRLICGMQFPTSGAYALYGYRNDDINIHRARHRMGAIVETPSIYRDMTAEDNLKQQMKILGLPSYEDIPRLLHLVGLSHVGTKKVHSFSLGMRQRLGIAIALCGSPDFLVLDEPINGLDPQGIIEIRELILKLNHENQITVLISSHILDELSKLATHYGFLDAGHIVKEISSKELDSTFRRSLRVTVSNTLSLSRTLERLKIEYRILSDSTADIFESMNITQLVNALSQDNCELISVEQRNETLESYYLSLVGGKTYE